MWIYRAIFSPLLLLAFLFGCVFSRKLREGFRQRIFHKPTHEATSSPLLWVHASSGEFEYAKPVIRAWKSRHPEWRVLVTYFSPSFVPQIQNCPEVDYSQPLPLDLPGPIQSFLRRYRPRLALIARTDLWPEMLYQCHQNSIPTLLFSATFSRFRTYENLFLPLWRWRFKYLSGVCCVSPEDQENLQVRGVRTPCFVTGETRIDQVLHRLENPKPLKSNLRPPLDALTLILGSTWRTDEQALLSHLTPFIHNGDLNLIIVPHEPSREHIHWLIDRLQSENLEAITYSQSSSLRSGQVLIVDQMGLLAELYLWADLAFVGGSFTKGVHSVLEPLAAGCMTFVGPVHTNSREALKFKTFVPFPNLGAAVIAIDKAEKITPSIKTLLSHKNELAKARLSIREELYRHEGATQRLIEVMEAH